MENTKTHNGDSKGTNENTEVCRLQVVPSSEIPGVAVEVTALKVLQQKHKVNPAKKGDSLEAVNAAELGGGKKPTIVVQDGKTILIPEQPKNKTQEIADKARSVRASANAKYEANIAEEEK